MVEELGVEPPQKEESTASRLWPSQVLSRTRTLHADERLLLVYIEMVLEAWQRERGGSSATDQ